MAVSPGLCLVSLLKPDQSPSSRQIFQVLSYLNYSQWKVAAGWAWLLCVVIGTLKPLKSSTTA
ncbi:hypothetical protein OUZ56_014326 [Daphnia magna]|uniref:Uncharacterized protein n=1 Tax=Daphnia magna TaxID=35525 RepID=A0ABR0AJE7_9CRUS|nr:hypothetical protein OUZ56_014326 [Daphnia magna]